jgi:hypothetical protein
LSFFAFLPVFLEGCGFVPTGVAMTTGTHTPIAAAATATPSGTVAPYTTTTFQETTPTPPTFVSTPLPTLSLSELEAYTDLGSSLNDCKLPCWNGLTPGLSTRAETHSLIARYGTHAVPSTAPFSGADAIRIPAANFDATFGFDGDRLLFIRLDFLGLPGSLERGAGFTGFGRLGMILMDIAGPGLEPGGPAYEIFLEFPEASLALGVRADAVERGKLCLFQDDVFLSYAILHSEGLDPLRVAFPGPWITLADPAEFTGLSSEEFAAAIVDPERCIPITSGY